MEKTVVHKRQIISQSHAGLNSQAFAADPEAVLQACALLEMYNTDCVCVAFAAVTTHDE